MSLAAIIASAEQLADGLKATIPSGWHQGRTAYGGLSAALALAGARACSEGLPPLRSAQIAFVGPLAGEVSVRARVLRHGRNATWIGAEITGEAGIGATASFVFMAPVESQLNLNNNPPPAPVIAPDEASPVPDRRRPAFLHNFDVRFAVPRTAERLPEIAWWVRHRQREGLDSVMEVLSIADALPPGVLPLLQQPVNVSSMTWLVNLLTPAPVTCDGWWLLRTASDYAVAGCSSQDMRVWNAEGAPVAIGMQSVALFG